jgi:ATP-binding cassette, subfamily F, member 3
MLHINDLTYRIEGRVIFDRATAGIPAGHKVGLVGRNGTGKTTLLRLICGEIQPDDGSTSIPKNLKMGIVAQEAPGGPETLLEWVLSADLERAALLAEADIATDPDRISEIHIRLADIESHSAPARAATILSGLGFDEAAQNRACSEFSGGWRMRVALGAILFLEPDLLLLDEPTNYLDLEGTMWLETYLKNYPHTVLMVSHDRDLLNRAVGHILHLEKGKLTLYTGGYDTFEETRREKQRLDLKLNKKMEDQRKHMQAFVDRFRYKASKAKQAQSRIKALEKLQPIAEHIGERVAPFVFPDPPKLLANPMIRIDEAVAGYTDNQPILSNLNLRIDQDDRIGLLGQNGNGKSTLAKLIAGRLKPMRGKRIASDKMSVGFFAQHQMDDLPDTLTPFDHMVRLMPDATEAQRRAKLGHIGFGHDKAGTEAHKLSGGEKARLLFAIAAFHAPHLLILDEPTNHLDVDAREALVMALNEYQGAVILISHDRHLLEASVDRLWVVRGGSVANYDGDMAQYRRECLDERSGRKRDKSKGAGASSAAGREDQRRDAAQRRADIAPLKKEIDKNERRMAELQQKLTELEKRLADPKLHQTDPHKASELAKERGRTVKALAEAEAAWLAAGEAYELAQV